MKRMLSLGFILIFGILLNECSDNPASIIPIFKKGILPLAVKNIWIYRIDEYVDSTGNASTHVTDSHMDTMEVVRDSMIGSEQWFAIRYSVDSNDGFAGEDFYINRSDGLYILTTQQQIGSEHTPSVELFIKYPMDIGDSVISDGEVSALTSVTDTLIIEGSAHLTYNYKFHAQYNPNIVTQPQYDLFSWDPTIGLLRWDHYVSDKLISQETLLSHKLY
jgi:hypothetical protein